MVKSLVRALTNAASWVEVESNTHWEAHSGLEGGTAHEIMSKRLVSRQSQVN